MTQVGGLPDETIAGYLSQLAARTAAPAGGAAAALTAAQAAALLAMTARYCDGPSHAGNAGMVDAAVAESDQVRHTCAALMAADGDAYGAVMAAYKLPKNTGQQQADRSAAIAEALITAAGPPTEVIAAGARLLALAQTLQPIVKSFVAPDLAAAVEAIRASVAISRSNVEASLSGITDPAARDRLGAVIAAAGATEARAVHLIAAVRTRYA